jgi:hypothetical protein
MALQKRLNLIKETKFSEDFVNISTWIIRVIEANTSYKTYTCNVGITSQQVPLTHGFDWQKLLAIKIK